MSDFRMLPSEKARPPARNMEIELWRFLFAVAIMAFHANYLHVKGAYSYFKGGRIGVEFFFLLSGFLLDGSIRRKGGPSTDGLARKAAGYLWKKIKSFYPYMVFAYVVCLVCRVLMGARETVLNYVIWVFRSLPELALLWGTGAVDNSLLNPVSWYLSVMLISSLILYIAVNKWGRVFSLFVAPVIGFFILGYLTHKFGYFTDPNPWTEHVNMGMLRGFAEMSIGVACAEISALIEKKSYSRGARVLFTAIEWICIAILLVYCWFYNPPKAENAVILLMSACLIMADQNVSLLAPKLAGSRVVRWLGRFSLMLFLNHFYWTYILKIIKLQLPYWQMTSVFFAGSIASSLLCWGSVDGARALWKRARIGRGV